MRRVRLLGLDFADFNVAEAATWLAARDAGAPFAAVVTPNADHLARLARTPGLRDAYAEALLCLLDSRVVARAARLLGLPTPAVCPGSDLAAALLEHHVTHGENICVIGLRAPWLPALRRRFGLGAVGHYDPPMGFWCNPVELARAADFVAAHPARFVFLAVGSPGQELLATAIARAGRATGVGLCVGAGLEFLAGARRRAPRWVQLAGLEWAHRLAQEPRRLARRYLIEDPLIFPLLLRARMAAWRGQGGNPHQG